jgi:hypothetical protein
VTTTFDSSRAPAAARAPDHVGIVPLGASLSIFLAVSFLLCALASFIPGLNVFHALEVLYPGIDWTNPPIIALGTIFAFGCGWYFAFFWGTLYNYFAARRG